MNKHTPGQWFYRPDWAVVEAQTKEGYNLCVAKCGGSYVLQDDEAKANARLIAASPELLEALEALLGRVLQDQAQSNLEYGPSGREIVEQARAAIAKAKGEA